MDKKRDAEIIVAHIAGEFKQLLLWQTLHINPTLSYERAKEIADNEIRETFFKLESAYKDFFENE